MKWFKGERQFASALKIRVYFDYIFRSHLSSRWGKRPEINYTLNINQYEQNRWSKEFKHWISQRFISVVAPKSCHPFNTKFHFQRFCSCISPPPPPPPTPLWPSSYFKLDSLTNLPRMYWAMSRICLNKKMSQDHILAITNEINAWL